MSFPTVPLLFTMAMSTASDGERDEQPKQTKSGSNQEEGSEEEEFEIEAILDAKRGLFPGVSSLCLHGVY